MGSTRVGFFEAFKGADALLIDIDAEGLRDLIMWVRDVISIGRKALLGDCPSASFRSGLRACLGRDDTGLLKTGKGAFVWQSSKEGRTDIVEKLSAMGTGAGHKYLDAPE